MKAFQECVLSLLLLLLVGAVPCHGYIEPVTHEQAALTLPRLLLHFPHAVALVEVARVDLERGLVRYRVVERISGSRDETEIRQVVALEGKVPPELRGLKVGQQAVLFGEDAEGQSLTYLEGVWYHAKLSEASWRRMTGLRPLYLGCFCGSVSELVTALKKLLLGQDAVVASRRPGSKPTVRLVRYRMKEPHRKVPVDGSPGEAKANDRAPSEPPVGDVDRLRAEQRRLELESLERRLGQVLTEKGENNEEARELRRELGKRLNAQPRGRERAEQALDETREHTERLKMLLREAGELAELLQKRLSPREEALNDETTELAAERTELTQRRQQLDRRLDELADRIRRSEGEQRERHLRQFRELANELVAVEKALCQHRLKALEHEADRLRRQIEHIERKNKEVIEDIIRRRLPSD